MIISVQTRNERNRKIIAQNDSNNKREILKSEALIQCNELKLCIEIKGKHTHTHTYRVTCAKQLNGINETNEPLQIQHWNYVFANEQLLLFIDANGMII